MKFRRLRRTATGLVISTLCPARYHHTCQVAVRRPGRVAMLATPRDCWQPKTGTHACTFGGNPIAAAAGIAMIETIEADGLLDKTQSAAAHNGDHLARMKEEIDAIAKYARQA